MSVRVVARTRPLLNSERDVDQILTTGADDNKSTTIKIPNPKNLQEEYSFSFSSVYDQCSTQQQIFEAEISPTVKHLFNGLDVTIFAYGSTGTGKTHTMRGGKALADRGMIPRLLSSIYRKSKALEKSTNSETTVQVSMSYYEIYNDRVFDLFEPLEKRTATGLPIREAEGGKTVIVGLTEEPCGTLKEFEVLYDRANGNRSTGATKLNAHSSRSHAILCVKLSVTTPTETRISTASAIDLAGSEDNRRTGNGKDRMVESASINKSLFVLSQCVEAISKKQSRIPYRESKMTRVLSVGQNNGICVMILNLAPTKSFHLDTLSSLNFANRTKKIEVREIENEPIFRGPPRQQTSAIGTGTGIGTSTIQRQPLRPLTHVVNVNLHAQREAKDATGKPAKAFSVYRSPLKRPGGHQASDRPVKQSRHGAATSRPAVTSAAASISTANLEALIDSRVRSALSAHTLSAQVLTQPSISDAVKARLDSIEQRLENVADDERAEGLSFLFMAKQHQARGEDVSALKMYELASGYFPGNTKLEAKIERLRERVRRKREQEAEAGAGAGDRETGTGDGDLAKRVQTANRQSSPGGPQNNEDESYVEDDEAPASDNESAYSSSDFMPRQRTKKVLKKRPLNQSADRLVPAPSTATSPRTQHLLRIINSRDVHQIKQLQGMGPKRAEGIVGLLEEQDRYVEDWQGLVDLKGLGRKGVERMREGLVV